MTRKRKCSASEEELISKKAKPEDELIEIGQSLNSSTIKEIETFFKRYLHDQLKAQRKFTDKIKKKVFKLEEDNIKHKAKIIDLENENATLKDEKEKLAQSSNNSKNVIKECDDLKVKLENEKIEKGELTENIKRLQMKLQEQDRVKAIELKRAREKHVSRINELEEENLLLVKDFKAKESHFVLQFKHLNNEIEDAKNLLKEKDNKIILKENESASFKEKYLKYKNNLKKAVAQSEDREKEKSTLMGKIQNLEIEKLSLAEKVEELTQKSDELYEQNKWVIQKNDDNQSVLKELAALETQLKENDKKINFQKTLLDEKNDEIAKVKKQNNDLLEEKEKKEKVMQLSEDKLIEEKKLSQQYMGQAQRFMNLLKENKEEQEKLKEVNSNLKEQIVRLNGMKEESRQEQQQLQEEKQQLQKEKQRLQEEKEDIDNDWGRQFNKCEFLEAENKKLRDIISELELRGQQKIEDQQKEIPSPNSESSDEEFESSPPDWDETYSDEESTLSKEDGSDTKGEAFDETLNTIIRVLNSTSSKIPIQNNDTNEAISESAPNPALMMIEKEIEHFRRNRNYDDFEKYIGNILETCRTKYEGFQEMHQNIWTAVKGKCTKKLFTDYEEEYSKYSLLSNETLWKIERTLENTARKTKIKKDKVVQ